MENKNNNNNMFSNSCYDTLKILETVLSITNNNINIQEDALDKSTVKDQIKRKKTLISVLKNHQKDYQHFLDDNYNQLKLTQKEQDQQQKIIDKIQANLSKEQKIFNSGEDRKEQIEDHINENREKIKEFSVKIDALEKEITRLKSTISPSELNDDEITEKEEKDEEEGEEKKKEKDEKEEDKSKEEQKEINENDFPNNSEYFVLNKSVTDSKRIGPSLIIKFGKINNQWFALMYDTKKDEIIQKIMNTDKNKVEKQYDLWVKQ